MEMKAKSFLGLLLILALALGLIPGMTMTAAAADYDLWVKGVQVTSANMADVLKDDPDNKGKVSYTPADGDTSPATLTLKGVKITQGYTEESDIYAIRNKSADHRGWYLKRY